MISGGKSGFNALFCGYRDRYGNYSGKNSNTFFWHTHKEYGIDGVGAIGLIKDLNPNYRDNSKVIYRGHDIGETCYSIRCLKD